ncbi:MAG: alkaline phosphatase family protein, partial [Verrucomicrobiales bacterium]|nr:alkaline phosphatase family protein [Verrucomicrobiales bacterium]
MKNTALLKNRYPYLFKMNSLALALGSALVLTPLVSGAEKATHVILISCDGLRPDAVEFLGNQGAPNLHRLIDEGAHTHNARTDTDFTVTLPNHTAMITGRGVAGESGHNWIENGTPKLGMHLHKNKKAYLESMFDVAHDHGLRTALFASKVKFRLFDISYSEIWANPDTVDTDNGKDKIDSFVFIEETDALITQFLEAVEEDPFQLSMLHLRDTDTAGHAGGWDIREGSPYLLA